MGEIENMAMKIFNAYEDVFYEKEKKRVFEELFDRYLTIADPVGVMEPYDAIVFLGHNHPVEYDQLIKALKENFLI
ncbi:MAG: hypothetical protein ACPL1G_08025 [Thermodesulfovibrionales bacterium]